MEPNNDFLELKKLYGESFAKFCRNLFPTILEIPNLLVEIISNKFAPNHTLYEDIIESNKELEFRNFIYFQYHKIIETERLKNISVQKPATLLAKAGYKLYECKTKKDMLQFRKYYDKEEMLCTFYENRTDVSLVFFAVKNDVQKYQRKDFPDPKREDDYSTSVLSIQFTKFAPNILSIKSRYNHTVSNPDATFGNDLDKIYPGLTDSFVKKYNLNLGNNQVNFYMRYYRQANDGKFYKFNSAYAYTYACANNVILKFDEVYRFSKDNYILFDGFLLDLQKKELKSAIEHNVDSFLDFFKNINKIIVTKDNKDKVLLISTNLGNAKIVLNQNNQIKEYENNNLTYIGDYFLFFSHRVEKFTMNNLKTIGNQFNAYNEVITELNFPSVESIGDDCLCDNKTLQKLYVPNLKTTGKNFSSENLNLKEIHLPELEVLEYGFVGANKIATVLYAPKVKKCEDGVFMFNVNFKQIYLPNVYELGNDCFSYNKYAKSIIIPNVLSMGNNCFANNISALTVDFRSLKISGNNLLAENIIAHDINLSSFQQCGDNCFCANKSLVELNVPQLYYFGKNFFQANTNMKIHAPNLTSYNSYNCTNPRLLEYINANQSLHR